MKLTPAPSDDFFLKAAHELRAPLTIIRWNAELLGTELAASPTAVQQKIANIHEQALKMIFLVNQILGVSRIIAGTSPNSPAPTDINALIQKEIVAARPIAGKEVSLSFSAKKGIPILFLDAARLSGVLQNLLSNAIKYNVRGGSVAVSADVDVSTLCIRIEDTGIGIPAVEQHKLFTNFFRASNAIQLNVEGSGLGLCIVQSYIEEVGGKVRIESPSQTGGKSGTAVTITIPLQNIRKERKE